MTYGCGAYICVSCYPFTYRCPNGHEYLVPVPNGEPEPDCPEALPLGEYGEDYGCEFTAEYMREVSA